EHAAEMIGPGRVHDPSPSPHGLSFLAHGIDQDELAFLVMSAHAVDDQLVGAVERDLDDVVGVGLAGEKAGHVEPGTRVGGRWSYAGGNQEQRSRGELHWRPATSASTTVGSANVEMSPK